MSIWRRGSLSQNPYYRHAFSITRVPTSTTRRKVVVAIIGQTSKVVKVDPDVHTIKGEVVTKQELVAAEQILLNPEMRVLETLLAHNEESLPIQGLNDLMTELDEDLKNRSEEAQLQPRKDGLKPLIDFLVNGYIRNNPAGLPSFGALELRLIPPFGWLEED